MTKADKTAADRVLNAACRKAADMTRNGAGHEAVVALLVAAGTAAEMLLDAAS